MGAAVSAGRSTNTLVQIVTAFVSLANSAQDIAALHRTVEIDPQYSPVVSEEDRNNRLSKVIALDNETAEVPVPRDYSDDVYKLRRDIDLVRRKLEGFSIDASA